MKRSIDFAQLLFSYQSNPFMSQKNQMIFASASYNLNTHDMLSPTNILDAYNVRAPCEKTLPLLVEAVKGLTRDKL